MFVIYVSHALNVQQLSEIWGQPYYTIRNGETQSYHHMLGQREWQCRINDTIKARNPRIVRIDDCEVDHLAALEFTGVMEDKEFQILGYIEDKNLEEVVNIYREGMISHFDQIQAIIRADAVEAITTIGVYDRIKIQKGSVTFNPKNKACVRDIQALDDLAKDKTKFLNQYVTDRIPHAATYIMLKGDDYHATIPTA